MSEQKSMTARIALTCTGSATLRQPDELEIVFDEGLLQAIAKALAVLSALNEIDARLTLPLDDLESFFRGEYPWPAKDTAEGGFVVSSQWMHVEAERLHIEIWEAYSNDELHGLMAFAEMPALRDVIEQHRRWGKEELLLSLCKTRPGSRLPASALLAPLVRALRLAEPWLVKLGDHIGNGTPEEPMGRCTALLAVRHALSLATGAAADAKDPGHH